MPTTSIDAYKSLQPDQIAEIYQQVLYSLALTQLDNGDWRQIVGYEGRFLITNSGVVISLPRSVNRKNGSIDTTKWMIKKQRITKFGYATCYLSKNKKYKHLNVHVLVALHFIGPKPSQKHQVNHKDGNKLNNHVSNLEWSTPSANLKHAYSIGLMCQKGENHATKKLNNIKVMEILQSTLSSKELCAMYDVSNSTIRNIKTGKGWSHITGIQYTPKTAQEEKSLKGPSVADYSREILKPSIHQAKLFMDGI